MYRVGRDACGNKAHACILAECCHKSPKWYCKKCDIEAHLRKRHDIDIVLPRGMRIKEEEGIFGVCFNNSKCQRLLKRFKDPKIKYHRNRQSYICKLKVTVVSSFNSTLVELRQDTKVEFVGRFMEHEMAIMSPKKMNGWRC